VRVRSTREGEFREGLPPLQHSPKAWLSRLRSGRDDSGGHRSVRGGRGQDLVGADRVWTSAGPLGPLQMRTLARLRSGAHQDDSVPGHPTMRDVDGDRIPAGPQDSMVSISWPGSSVQSDFRAVQIMQGEANGKEDAARCYDAAPSGPARPATRGLALAMSVQGEFHKLRPASRRPSSSFVNSDAPPLRDHLQTACTWFQPSGRFESKCPDDRGARTGSGCVDQRVLSRERGHTRRGQRDSSCFSLSSRGRSAKRPEVEVL
jgi:hypothetical protein